MGKYKVGDRVRIVNRRTEHMNFFGDMDKWLGQTMTIKAQYGNGYKMVEDAGEHFGAGWYWEDEMIANFAELQMERHDDNDLSVAIRFDGNKTTAWLIRGKDIVKTATARRNPADKYRHAKGAALAVERLFEKEARKPKVGDKFVVTGVSSPIHYFKAGEIVTFAHPGKNGTNTYRNEFGLDQVCNVLDVEPYKGEPK